MLSPEPSSEEIVPEAEPFKRVKLAKPAGPANKNSKNPTYVPPSPPHTTTTNTTTTAKLETRSCFPSDAVVTRADGKEVRMSSLRIGDLVETSPGRFSPVLLFSHADPSAGTEVSLITGAKGRVAASPGHLISLNGRLSPIRTARVGDMIAVSVDGALVSDTVRMVSVYRAAGLYNPQTASGRILVRYGNGGYVLMSAYTEAVNAGAAHAALAPLRVLYSLLGASIPSLSLMFPGTVWSAPNTRAGVLVRNWEIKASFRRLGSRLGAHLPLTYQRAAKM
eukprot:IDg8696t1